MFSLVILYEEPYIQIGIISFSNAIMAILSFALKTHSVYDDYVKNLSNYSFIFISTTFLIFIKFFGESKLTDNTA